MELKLYDYTETINDDWLGSYEQFYYIGQGNLSASVVVPLIESTPEDEEILVKINSCGGYVFDGWAIYNALKNHKGNVTVRIDGLAASIASIIAMAGAKVIICQASMLMIHKPTVDPFWYGSMNAEDLKREATALDQIQAVLNSIYTSRTGLDKATIDSMINAETYITPDEAIALGFADSLDQTISKVTMAENAFNHIFKNADVKVRAYANVNIKKQPTMNVQESLKKVNETSEKTNTLLTDLGNWFKNDLPKIFKNEQVETVEEEPVNASVQLENESYIYFDGELAIGTAVFTDEAKTTPAGDGDHTLMDGRTITVMDGKVTAIAEAMEQEDAVDVTELQAENLQLKEALNKANQALETANTALTEIKNLKSKYVPAARATDFSKPKAEAEDKVLDMSPEARAARAEARKNKKK